MPIYEYACTACDREFELLVRSTSEGKKAKCPACRSTAVVRRLSVFAARQGAPSPLEGVPGGACGRCGDPNGPCSL